MKYNFCTLFNKAFLNRGIALYNSILKNCPEPFNFFILCMDDETYKILLKLELRYVTLLKIGDLESEYKELKVARNNRTAVEYCWTLSPSLPTYILEKNPSMETITYLDADLFFYSSIEPIYQVFGNNSVMIIPHRIFGDTDVRERNNGKYNVGMLIFRNNPDGRECLEWWRQRCVEWCYDKVEPTRYGDQKYLDYFEEKFKGVYVLPWKGVCLAPWNIGSYKGKIRQINNGIVSIDGDNLIFFHFSRFKIYLPRSSWLPAGPLNLYHIPSVEKRLMYGTYTKAMYEAMDTIHTISPGFIEGVLQRPPWYIQVREITRYYVINLIKNVIRPILKMGK